MMEIPILMGPFADRELFGMNDLVAGMSISRPKTPKRVWPSSYSHDGDGVNRQVCMSVCIALAEKEKTFLTSIKDYMRETDNDSPITRSFDCQLDLWHPHEKSVSLM